MKATGIKLQELTIDQILNHEANEYNPQIWQEKVQRYAELDAKFYQVSNSRNSYAEFYVTYKIDGLKILADFGFGNTLTNRGFKRVYISAENEIIVQGFGQDGTQAVKNDNAGRKFLKDNICNYGVLVTTEF